MVRAPYFDENGTKKGAWSEEEDQMLIAHIQRHGHANWRQLPKVAAESLPGRSDNEIKNYWHSHLKKFSRRNETKLTQEIEMTKTLESSFSIKANSSSISSSHVESNMDLYRIEDDVASWETWDGFSNNFWTEPFVYDNTLSQDYFPISYCALELEDPYFIC
ncbi:hypothetical protein RYX36_037160 [Vicia faba]